MAIRRRKKLVHAVKAACKFRASVRRGTSLKLEIYARKEKLGEFIVGSGSLFWYGRGRQKRKRIDWSEFAEIMDEMAYVSKG